MNKLRGANVRLCMLKWHCGNDSDIHSFILNSAALSCSLLQIRDMDGNRKHRDLMGPMGSPTGMGIRSAMGWEWE